MTHQADPALVHYISAAQAYPELSREQELALITSWLGQGDEAARDQLVRSQLRYVIFIATKYRRYGLPISELVAEGNFGLVHALQKFDPSRGTRFGAYGSHWIRAYILDYVLRSWTMVSGSAALRSKLFFKIRRERARILNWVADGEQADALLARRLDLPQAKVSAMVRALETRDVSLDAPVFGDSPTSLGETLVAREPSQEDRLARSESYGYARDAVHDALTLLDPRERYIVE
ncbi:MAG TPA: sigma-70 family RNA polymerase sigma factor, partial [Polyangiaceae bacterium]|nr:sigma-70 family RNA polymerase sigma factor [Polyangiaceae bacterium]